MAIAISEGVDRGKANPQPFRPYVIPNYHERHSARQNNRPRHRPQQLGSGNSWRSQTGSFLPYVVTPPNPLPITRGNVLALDPYWGDRCVIYLLGGFDIAGNSGMRRLRHSLS